MPRPITPPVAADVIIELVDRPGRPFVLIERLYEPFGWAIPGGFVDVGESVEKAAVREALEETSLSVTLTEFLGCYSKPGRDPRGHTISLVYIGEARGEPKAQDDAKAFRVCTLSDMPGPLAFDHDVILRHYGRLREKNSISRLNLG